MADRRVADLIKDIRGDAQLLINDQLELAKAELTPAAKNAGIGGGLFGAAGYFGINAATLIYIAAAFGLAALGLPYWAAFLIVAGVLLVIAGDHRADRLQPDQEGQGPGEDDRQRPGPGLRAQHRGQPGHRRRQRAADRGHRRQRQEGAALASAIATRSTPDASPRTTACSGRIGPGGPDRGPVAAPRAHGQRHPVPSRHR